MSDSNPHVFTDAGEAENCLSHATNRKRKTVC